MLARTVGELIASCYTLTLDEYLDIYVSPMFIGVGVIDARMFGQRDQLNSTLMLSLHPEDSSDEQKRHQLMGYLIPVARGDGASWSRLGLGRTDENDIVIKDPAVSEFHGYIKVMETEMVLGDLGSTNGTKVNGIPLKAPNTHVLRDQDIVTFGRLSFQYFTPYELYQFLSLGHG